MPYRDRPGSYWKTLSEPAGTAGEAIFTEPERCPRCKGTGFIGKEVDVEGKPIPDTEGEQECKHDLAERESACYTEGLCPICLQAAIAVERERFDAMEDKWQALAASRYDDVKLLRAKLAAERAKPKTTEYAQGWDDHLMAAKAEKQLLVDALTKTRELMGTGGLDECYEIIATALAKVKEGKSHSPRTA